MAAERGLGARARLLALPALLMASPAGCERERSEVIIEHEPGAPVAPRRARSQSPKGQQGQQAHEQARPGPPANQSFAPTSGAGYQGYVRPAYGPDHWEPAAEDIAALEQRVPEALAGAVERGDVPALDREASAYTRQYYGYIKDGHKMIEVRFYCDRRLAAMDVHIRGGGPCYFKAVYDTRTGAFIGFK